MAGSIDLRELIGVSEAAELIGVAPSQLRRMIRDGEAPARKLGGALGVPVAEAQRLASLPRADGRPYSPKSAWAIIGMLAGQPPADLSVSRRWQVARHLDDADPADLAARMRRRARRELLHVHPGLVDRLLADPRVRRGGWSADLSPFDLVVGDDLPAEGYAHADDLAALRDQYLLEPAEQSANLVLHVVEGVALPQGPLPPAAVAFDLLEWDDPRARSAARAYLDHALRTKDKA